MYNVNPQGYGSSKQRVVTYLILNEEFDTLNGSSSSFGDGSRYTTH